MRKRCYCQEKSGTATHYLQDKGATPVDANRGQRFFCCISALIYFCKLNDDAAQALVAGLQVPFLLAA